MRTKVNADRFSLSVNPCTIKTVFFETLNTGDSLLLNIGFVLLLKDLVSFLVCKINFVFVEEDTGDVKLI